MSGPVRGRTIRRLITAPHNAKEATVRSRFLFIVSRVGANACYSFPHRTTKAMNHPYV